MHRFSEICGEHITKLSRNRTRTEAWTDGWFNVVLSDKPLLPENNFSVRVKKATNPSESQVSLSDLFCDANFIIHSDACS